MFCFLNKPTAGFGTSVKTRDALASTKGSGYLDKQTEETFGNLSRLTPQNMHVLDLFLQENRLASRGLSAYVYNAFNIEMVVPGTKRPFL